MLQLSGDLLIPEFNNSTYGDHLLPNTRMDRTEDKVFVVDQPLFEVSDSPRLEQQQHRSFFPVRYGSII
jgi:hypothetical protein